MVIPQTDGPAIVEGKSQHGKFLFLPPQIQIKRSLFEKHYDHNKKRGGGGLFTIYGINPDLSYPVLSRTMCIFSGLVL